MNIHFILMIKRIHYLQQLQLVFIRYSLWSTPCRVMKGTPSQNIKHLSMSSLWLGSSIIKGYTCSCHLLYNDKTAQHSRSEWNDLMKVIIFVRKGTMGYDHNRLAKKAGRSIIRQSLPRKFEANSFYFSLSWLCYSAVMWLYTTWSWVQSDTSSPRQYVIFQYPIT